VESARGMNCRLRELVKNIEVVLMGVYQYSRAGNRPLHLTSVL
jgi:hypothetical protein